jgi:mevalonate kinase
VVYGQPALAAPVTQVQATATITPAEMAGENANPEASIWIDALDINRHYRLSEALPSDPIAAAIRLTLAKFSSPASFPSPFALALRSTIPIASGLGSGAAVCTATVRGLGAYLGRPLSDAEVSALVYETEKLLHGTPSGIDNTVVAYGQPVYFVRGQAPLPFNVAQPFWLVIGDTGLPSPTKIAVGEVRQAYEKEPARYTALFQAIGEIANQARNLIEGGAPDRLGPLMNRNHALLREMGISSPELDRLVESAGHAGATGAKLSGGGRGGNMIALATSESAPTIAAALLASGAARALITDIRT